MTTRRTRAATRRTPRTSSPTPRARRRRAGTAANSQLDMLAGNLQELNRRVSLVGTPLHAVRDAIVSVRKPLAFPGEVAKRLKQLREVVVGVKTIATGLSWLPGPIGTGATALERVSKPLVEGPPPPPGSIAKLQKAIERVDASLKPARDAVDKVKTPLDKACGAVDAIAGKLVFLAGVVDGLVRRYGAHPPPEIDSCAGRLNTPVAAVLAAMRDIEEKLATSLRAAQAALAQAEQILAPLGRAIDALTSALKTLDSPALRKIRSLLNQLVKAVEPYINMGRTIINAALATALKKLGVDARKIVGFLDGLARKIDPTRPIRDAINKIQGKVAALAGELARSLGVVAVLDQLEKLRERLEREIDMFLASACGQVLMPGAGARARA